jgi:pimeloyl-ACP methyl ester carboxylesterase
MRHLRSAWGFLVLGLLVLASQIALGQGVRRVGPGGPGAQRVCNRAIILVADGVGQLHDLTENLTSANELADIPATIRSIPWMRNTEEPLCDYKDQDAQLLGSAKMAYEVLQIRRSNPNIPITLIGFCAGGRVVLAAAEQLPPGAVDRIILLAPAVSSFYDIRPALRASRLGIDVFYVPEDSYLERLEQDIGTAEGKKGVTAGRVGFCLAKRPGDPIQAAVRQFLVVGGHYTPLHVNFLAQRVLPLVPTVATPGGIITPTPVLPPGGPAYPPPGGPAYSPPPLPGSLPPPGAQSYPVPPPPGPAYAPPPPPAPGGVLPPPPPAPMAAPSSAPSIIPAPTPPPPGAR